MEKALDDVEIEEVEEDEHIEFKGYTDKFGRAYWYIGVERREEGIIEAVYFIPSQQPDSDVIYKYEPELDYTDHRIEPGRQFVKSSNSMQDMNYRGTSYCSNHDLVEEKFVMPAAARKLEITESTITGIEIKVRG